MRRGLAFVFAQACLGVALLAYPAYLHFGAHNGFRIAAAKEQFDFCQLADGEDAQSCALTTRLAVRTIQSEAEDERACVQASNLGKFIFHPRRDGNWDKTLLVLYANTYGGSDQLSKWLKAKLAQIMLRKHRQIDERCYPPIPQGDPYPAEYAYP